MINSIRAILTLAAVVGTTLFTTGCVDLVAELELAPVDAPLFARAAVATRLSAVMVLMSCLQSLVVVPGLIEVKRGLAGPPSGADRRSAGRSPRPRCGLLRRF